MWLYAFCKLKKTLNLPLWERSQRSCLIKVQKQGFQAKMSNARMLLKPSKFQICTHYSTWMNLAAHSTISHPISFASLANLSLWFHVFLAVVQCLKWPILATSMRSKATSGWSLTVKGNSHSNSDTGQVISRVQSQQHCFSCWLKVCVVASCKD